VERGGPDDTCVVLLTDPDGRCPGSSRVLKPGATARIFLREYPAETREPERRAFKLMVEDDPAESYFTYRFTREQGRPVGEVEFDAGLDPRLDLAQTALDELVFCGLPRR